MIEVTNNCHFVDFVVPQHLKTISSFEQGKFIRIHFAASGKLASADIETCKKDL